MRFAYADPPYMATGTRARAAAFYGERARVYESVDGQAELIRQLAAEYPDGWALSMSSPSLRHLLPLCPDAARVGAWVKPFHMFHGRTRPAYAWEPVVYVGGRNSGHVPPAKGGKANTPRDWVSANMTLRKGLTGAKPEAFCLWILALLNYQPGDELVDVFPGSNAMADALAVVHAEWDSHEEP